MAHPLTYWSPHVINNGTKTEYQAYQYLCECWLARDLNWSSQLLTIASEKGRTFGAKVEPKLKAHNSLLADPVVLGGKPSKQQIINGTRRRRQLRGFA